MKPLTQAQKDFIAQTPGTVRVVFGFTVHTDTNGKETIVNTL